MTHALAHVDTWIFDLDNTLYPPEARLFDEIEVRMTDYVMRTLGLDRAAASRLRADYWAEYGTTLAGMMDRHGTDPCHFLNDVHDISFATLTPNPTLATAITALPGRKIVFTNADGVYARKVLGGVGLADVFDGIFAVEDTDFIPKPSEAAYERVIRAAGLDPEVSAMFEDDHRNLLVPHDLGMATVLVGPEREAAPHLHFQTQDLAGFLSALPRNAVA